LIEQYCEVEMWRVFMWGVELCELLMVISHCKHFTTRIPYFVEWNCKDKHYQGEILNDRINCVQETQKSLQL